MSLNIFHVSKHIDRTLFGMLSPLLSAKELEVVATFPHRYSILNTFVNALSMDETIAYAEEIIASGKPTQHATINAAKINRMRKDARLRSIINNSPLISADGQGILLAGKFLGVPLHERVTGCDLFQRLAAVSEEKKYRIFLLGASRETVKKVHDNLLERHPALQIVGYHTGYFSKKEAEVIHAIANSHADILFVAFGTPRQEYWIHDHLNKLNVPFVMGVGGSFEIVAGNIKRAPLWFQNHGLEWFYRFLQEPRRLRKRGFIESAIFVTHLAQATVRAKFK